MIQLFAITVPKKSETFWGDVSSLFYTMKHNVDETLDAEYR